MSHRPASIVLLTAIGLALVAAVASAQHSTPPSYVDAGPLTLTVSGESRNGEIYHDTNAAGRSGTKCTGTTSDDGASDTAGECVNDRSQLRGKDVTTAEGTAASCQRVQGASVPGAATWDGVWFNRTPTGTVPDACGDPTTGGAKGRAYTGAAISSVGSAGVAGGGDLATGGCVQVFVEDDTSGNAIASAVNAALNATGGGHTGSDDDTDTAVCFDYL